MGGKLTVKMIESVKFEGRQVKLTDGSGLYLLIQKSGKYWRYDYRYFGKRKTLSLGVFPDVALKQARKDHDKARALLSDGTDPSQEKKDRKIAKEIAMGNSFRSVVDDWKKRKGKGWSAEHRRVTVCRLENDIIPYVGHRPVAEITAPEILAVCRRVESRGAISSAHRVRGIIGYVLRYGVACGMLPFDPTPGLIGALETHTVKHMDSITETVKIGKLLQALESCKCSEITRAALHLTPHVFLRPGELQQAEWCEFDLEGRLWRIPAEKMKGKQEHLIPLSQQAMAIIIGLRPLTGHRRYLFPGNRPEKPLSGGTICGVLKRAGYGPGVMTAHGFRHMASTRLHDVGVPSYLVEKQLAHKDLNTILDSYNAADYLDDRTTMMQYWSDCIDAYQAGRKPLKWKKYCEALKDGGNVVPLRSVI